jgi:hypothetical protein
MGTPPIIYKFWYINFEFWYIWYFDTSVLSFGGDGNKPRSFRMHHTEEQYIRRDAYEGTLETEAIGGGIIFQMACITTDKGSPPRCVRAY